jgi:hypothetical protein
MAMSDIIYLLRPYLDLHSSARLACCCHEARHALPMHARVVSLVFDYVSRCTLVTAEVAMGEACFVFKKCHGTLVVWARESSSGP